MQTPPALPTPDAPDDRPPYEAPTLTSLGTIGELTQKTVGSADGSTFLGLDIGS